MSVQWMDDFSSYGTDRNLLLEGNYAEWDGFELRTDPITGVGKVGWFNTAQVQNAELRWVYPGSPVLSIGCAMRATMPFLPNTVGRNPVYFQPRSVSNVAIASVTADPSGRLQIRRGTGTGTILATSTVPVIIPNSWQHIECKLVIDPTVGSLEVRVEGVTVLSLTNADFGSTAAGMVAWQNDVDSVISAPPWYIKDLVVWDTLGSDNTNFLGSVIVTSLLPASDVALNWTPVGGLTGFGILDNSPPLNTQYIQATDALPAAYVASLTDLPTDITSVKAVMTMVRAGKIDGGDASLQVSVVSGASTGNGVNRPITTAPIYWKDVFERDPATSAAWLPVAVNALNLKINRTS